LLRFASANSHLSEPLFLKKWRDEERGRAEAEQIEAQRRERVVGDYQELVERGDVVAAVCPVRHLAEARRADRGKEPAAMKQGKPYIPSSYSGRLLRREVRAEATRVEAKSFQEMGMDRTLAYLLGAILIGGAATALLGEINHSTGNQIH
jgi:hypothetical protein